MISETKRGNPMVNLGRDNIMRTSAITRRPRSRAGLDGRAGQRGFGADEARTGGDDSGAMVRGGPCSGAELPRSLLRSYGGQGGGHGDIPPASGGFRVLSGEVFLHHGWTWRGWRRSQS